MLIIQRPQVEAGEAEGNLQQFTIAPLEPGFGHTLGNSLRRTLLSSIPGAAVTQVRFDEALHEFDVIPGVKEDVTDLILNIKDLVLTCTADEPVTLRLDARGPGEVTAGDIQTTADVEILNPELHLATVNAKGRLAVDLTVEQGRGYLSAERNKRTSTIGLIPVDAIFSPVRRVAFTVEPTRVEQATNYDKLTLEIETDGSISPRDALSSAGDTLRNLVALVADLSDEPRGLELGEVAPSTASPDLELPDRGARAVGASAQLPQARPGRHHRPAGDEDRGRPPRDHELRFEVARRGPPEARRAGPRPADQGVTMPTPKKGPRIGRDPAHQRLILANMASSLFEAGYVVTTVNRAKMLRPYAEHIITKAKKGGVHQRRQVIATIHDQDVTHKLFAEIGPRYRDRPGGYLRILKLGPRPGDNAPMARIELV